MTRERRRAEEVARGLFTNGHGEEAQRLVLELPGKRDGGGWCLGAVTDRIEAALLAERARATRSALDGLARIHRAMTERLDELEREIDTNEGDGCCTDAVNRACVVEMQEFEAVIGRLLERAREARARGRKR